MSWKVFGTSGRASVWVTWHSVQKYRRGVTSARTWARMEANDSLECRNCHSAIAMDFTKQSNRAAAIHAKFLISKERTCIAGALTSCRQACVRRSALP
jgi:nitrate/TMAO reductase-like tetraheme cytochrome c subunit